MNDENSYEIAADNLGQDLLAILLQEIKVLPDVWQRLPEHKQNDVIDRIRLTVEESVATAVRLIATQGCQRILGELVKVTMSDKKEAVIRIESDNTLDQLHALYESVREPVMIVVANEHQFTGGMHEIKGEPDQNDAFGANNDASGVNRDYRAFDPEEDAEEVEEAFLPSPEEIEPPEDITEAEFE